MQPGSQFVRHVFTSWKPRFRAPRIFCHPGKKSQRENVPPITFSHVNVPWFFFIKVDDERFYWNQSFQYLIFLLVILSILSHLGCYNDRKLQNYWDFAPDTTWWVYNTPHCLIGFLFSKNYKCPLKTLPLQSVRPSDGPE